jgi:hypothetical protein
MAAEGKIRKALKERVEAYGGEIRAVSWLGRRNAPDVLCLFPEGWHETQLTRLAGTHPFIETKAPDGKPTAAQAREHERMHSAGCTVLVISTLAQLDAWLPPT